MGGGVGRLGDDRHGCPVRAPVRFLIPARPLSSRTTTTTRPARGSSCRALNTIQNWAAKTANWLRDEHDVEPGDPVAVLLPAHWQTAGVLLGAWWCGATVTDDPADAKVAVVAPGVEAPGALVTAVASLHPMGLGSGAPVDYNDDVRVFGDDFAPGGVDPRPQAPRCSSPPWTKWWEEAHQRAGTLGITTTSRVLSTVEWTMPDGLLNGFLAVLAGGGSLVQCSKRRTGACWPRAAPASRRPWTWSADLDPRPAARPCDPRPGGRRPASRR